MALQAVWIQNCETRETLQCLFNPTEYSVGKENAWQSKPVVGKNVPKLTFSGGGAKTLTVELFFDTYEAGSDVRDHTDKLFQLTLIHPVPKNDKNKRSRPPLCIFHWGANFEFKAAVMKLQVKYTLFRDDGTPVRATATLTLQEAEDENEQAGQNPTSQADDTRRRRAVRPYDTLAIIAAEEYGDANRWRLIADANRLDNPLDIEPGQVLTVPPLP